MEQRLRPHVAQTETDRWQKRPQMPPPPSPQQARRALPRKKCWEEAATRPWSVVECPDRKDLARPSSAASPPSPPSNYTGSATPTSWEAPIAHCCIEGLQIAQTPAFADHKHLRSWRLLICQPFVLWFCENHRLPCDTFFALTLSVQVCVGVGACVCAYVHVCMYVSPLCETPKVFASP